jgi:2-polyprenyl-3-methyl-5-hydroxy-6-metoxy-1,4-benzoquinol methylase
MNSTLEYYNNNVRSLLGRYNSANVTSLHKRLLNCFPEGAKLLDAGCGSGRDADFMIRMNYDVLAVDASDSMIQGAVKHFPLLRNSCRQIIIPGELSQLGQNSFDGIYSIAMLMHLNEADIKNSLLEFKRLLIKNGRLFFSVCLTRSSEITDDLDSDGRRFTLRPESWWHNLCISTGFSIIESDISSDGLSRDKVQWLNLLCRKDG